MLTAHAEQVTIAFSEPRWRLLIFCFAFLEGRPLATHTLPSVNSAALSRRFDQLARLADFKSFAARGTYLIDRTFDVLPEHIGADGDVLELLQFPSRTSLVTLRLVLSELDGGGAMTSSLELIHPRFGDQTLLIDSTTIGQDGGAVDLDTTEAASITDVSGQILRHRVLVAPSPAVAGTLRIIALVTRGAVVTDW